MSASASDSTHSAKLEYTQGTHDPAVTGAVGAGASDDEDDNGSGVSVGERISVCRMNWDAVMVTALPLSTLSE